MKRTLAGLALVAGAALSACGGASHPSTGPAVKAGAVAPSSAQAVAVQLGSLCPSPAPAAVVETVESLDCGGGLKVETFASAAKAQEVYDEVGAATIAPGTFVFVGPTIVQTPDAATATRAASLTGGTVK